MDEIDMEVEFWNGNNDNVLYLFVKYNNMLLSLFTKMLKVCLIENVINVHGVGVGVDVIGLNLISSKYHLVVAAALSCGC